MRRLIKVIILLGLLLILMVAAGSFVLSNNGLASPGNPLYPVQYRAEQLQAEPHPWANPKVDLHRAPVGIKIK